MSEVIAAEAPDDKSSQRAFATRIGQTNRGPHWLHAHAIALAKAFLGSTDVANSAEYASILSSTGFASRGIDRGSASLGH